MGQPWTDEIESWSNAVWVVLQHSQRMGLRSLWDCWDSSGRMSRRNNWFSDCSLVSMPLPPRWSQIQPLNSWLDLTMKKRMRLPPWGFIRKNEERKEIVQKHLWWAKTMVDPELDRPGLGHERLESRRGPWYCRWSFLRRELLSSRSLF